MKKLDVIEMIYTDVFCNTFNQACYVFLCGGAANGTMRNRIRPMLVRKKFEILYPEDLFMEMLNRDRKSDLLEYENLLAHNSDIVCVICESIGSAVELGAFAQNEEIKKKMVVAVNRKYARDQSFVMLGPVKHLKKANKNSTVVYKNDDPVGLTEELSKVFRNLHRKGKNNKEESFDNLSAYIAFIPMIIYFYQAISRKVLFKNLEAFLNRRECLPSEYRKLFNAAVKYLLKSGKVVTEYDLEQKDEIFSLSLKGYKETLDLIEMSSAHERTILHDRIRCAILKGQLNN